MDKRLNKRIRYNNNTEYIDNSWSSVPLPWNWEMTHDDCHVRIKEDFTAGQVVEFSRGTDIVAFQPMALEWTNDLDQIQPIEMPNDVVPVVDHNETELTEGVINNQGYVRWNDAYGSGIDFRWECAPGTLEKRLIISDISDLPAPEPYIIAGGNPCLRLNLIFDPTNDLIIWVDGGLWDKKSKVQTFNHIIFRRDSETVFSFKPLRYWSSDDIQDGESVATLDKKGNSLYISILVPYSWLQTAVYPVYVDADVTIDSSVDTQLRMRVKRVGPFWVSTTVCYIIYVDSDGSLVYQKSSDGGGSWGGAVTLVSGGAIGGVDCWADWQTDGDSGTVIHISYVEGGVGVGYYYLDTSDDSEGGSAIYSGSVSNPNNWVTMETSICKSRGGNLYVAWKCYALGTQWGFDKSSDGSSWTSKATLWEDDDDYVLLFAGNEADNDDIWATYWDYTASEISLKTYDQSGNSWSEQSIAGSMTLTQYYYINMDGQIRLSDGHLIFVAWSILNQATSDLMCWDINGAGSITAKTNIITDTAEYASCSVFINQVNDDIYVSYCGGTDWTSLTKCYYQKSADGGANWGGQTAMQADAEDDERWTSAGCIKAANGGKFLPIWYNIDLYDIFCNTDNAVSIAASGGGIPIAAISEYYHLMGIR